MATLLLSVTIAHLFQYRLRCFLCRSVLLAVWAEWVFSGRVSSTPLAWLASQSISSIFLSHQISTSHQLVSSTFIS